MTWWFRCCPADWHVKLAALCIDGGAHFVSSSYISPEMRALDAKARAAGVALVNEVGLDPGIDHLMAHWLVADYRRAPGYDPKNVVSFISYCGGVPKHHERVSLQVFLVAARGAEGAEIAVALDPGAQRAGGSPAVGCDLALRRPPAGARELRGLPEPRFAAVHGRLRLRRSLAGEGFRARHAAARRAGPRPGPRCSARSRRSRGRTARRG